MSRKTKGYIFKQIRPLVPIADIQRCNMLYNTVYDCCKLHIQQSLKDQKRTLSSDKEFIEDLGLNHFLTYRQ